MHACPRSDKRDAVSVGSSDQEMIKKGDALLNSVQKLVRFIELEQG